MLPEQGAVLVSSSRLNVSGWPQLSWLLFSHSAGASGCTGLLQMPSLLNTPTFDSSVANM